MYAFGIATGDTDSTHNREGDPFDLTDPAEVPASLEIRPEAIHASEGGQSLLVQVGYPPVDVELIVDITL